MFASYIIHSDESETIPDRFVFRGESEGYAVHVLQGRKVASSYTYNHNAKRGREKSCSAFNIGPSNGHRSRKCSYRGVIDTLGFARQLYAATVHARVLYG